MSNEQRRLAGRYVLEERIGRGGMGEVWRGTDSVLGREVAVKLIDLRTVPDESGAARFEREARATAGLSHEGVVTVHDSGVEDHTAYLVMELLPGPSLAERIAAGPVPVDEVVEVGRQVASALEAAHARGLVHRDIKPGNIAYAADGRVRVLDFGITQLAESTGSQSLTATHTVMGTAEYLAPEQALGGRVDGRADLYALGCVLHALLAGQPPFRGPTPVATMMMHANDLVPDVRDLRPDTPDWLADLVHDLLAKQPDQRPESAAAVAVALEEGESIFATRAMAAGDAAATQRMTPSAPVPVPVPLPPSDPPRDVEPERGGPGALTWVLALVAAAALGLLLWQFMRGDDSGTPTAGPSVSTPAVTTPPPSSSPPPTTEAASPTPTPTPTTEAPTPTPEPDLGAEVTSTLSAFSDEVGSLQRGGVLDADSAEVLDDIVGDIRQGVREDDPVKTSAETDKLVEEYDKLVDSGAVTTEAALRLGPLLADVQTAVDAFAA